MKTRTDRLPDGRRPGASARRPARAGRAPPAAAPAAPAGPAASASLSSNVPIRSRLVRSPGQDLVSGQAFCAVETAAPTDSQKKKGDVSTCRSRSRRPTALHLGIQTGIFTISRSNRHGPHAHQAHREHFRYVAHQDRPERGQRRGRRELDRGRVPSPSRNRTSPAPPEPELAISRGVQANKVPGAEVSGTTTATTPTTTAPGPADPHGHHEGHHRLRRLRQLRQTAELRARPRNSHNGLEPGTHTDGAWMVNPYLQYTTTPARRDPWPAGLRLDLRPASGQQATPTKPTRAMAEAVGLLLRLPAQPVPWTQQQRLVLHFDAHLPVQDLFRARGSGPTPSSTCCAGGRVRPRTRTSRPAGRDRGACSSLPAPPLPGCGGGLPIFRLIDVAGNAQRRPARAYPLFEH